MDSADSGPLDDSASTVDLGLRKSHGGSSSDKPVFIDNYLIEQELGHGGMGEVYLATEQGLNRQVALKVLQAANRISSKQVKRFLLEAQAAAQLSHDNIVPIYHVGECQGIHYFTMRFIEGHDLSVIIRNGQRALREMSHGSIDTQVASEFKHKSKTGKSGDSTVKDRADSTNGLIDLSADSFVGSQRSTGSRSAHRLAISVALIGQAVAEALQHAHEHGIVHRDIKPSNLMLDHTNKIWVTDFGLAQLQNAEGLTNTGDILGTLRYMSPEQATGQKAFIDHRTDIYSLGVTLYELATLQKACRGESAQEILRSITFERPQPIRKVNPKLPRDLETIICKATERNPLERYQTAAEMARDLERFANSQSLLTRRPSRLKALRNWVWDRPAISAMALAMLLVFAGSMIVMAWANQGRFEAEQRRADEVAKSLTISQGQQMLSQAMLLKDVNPGLAIAAGIVGASTVPGPTADRILMSAVDRNHELRTIPHELKYPGKCICSEDGRIAVICSRPSLYGKASGLANILDLVQGKVLGQLRDDLPLTDAVFLGSDRYLLTNSISVDETSQHVSLDEIKFGAMKVWDTTSMSVVKVMSGCTALRIKPECYSRINQQLVLPHDSNTAIVYSVPELSQAMIFPNEHTKRVLECLFSEDGNKVATWSLDETVILWDAKTGRMLRRIVHKCPRPTSASIHFTHNSNQLCISDDSGTRFINLIDETAPDIRREERMVKGSRKTGLAYLKGRDRASVVVFSTDTGASVSSYKSENAISDVIPFNSDRNVAVVENNVITIFDSQKGTKVAQLRGHKDRIQSGAAVASRSEVISLAWDGTVRVWELRSDLQRRTLDLPFESITPALVTQSADSGQVLLGNITISDSSVFEIESLKKAKASFPAEVVAVLSGGHMLTTDRNSVAIWDSNTRRKMAAIPVDIQKSSAIDAAIDFPKLRKIALLSPRGDVSIWDLHSSRLSTYQLGGERATSIAALSDDQLLIGDSGGQISSLNLVTYGRHTLTALPTSPLELDVRNVEPRVLITGANETAYLLDTESKALVHSYKQSGIALRSSKFVGGDRFVTHGGMASKSLQIWNAKSGELIESISTGPILDVCVNSDRTKLAASTKTEVFLWDVATDAKRNIDIATCNSLCFTSDHLIMSRVVMSRNDVPSREALKSTQIDVWDLAKQQSIATQSIQKNVKRILPMPEFNGFCLVGTEFGVACVSSDAARPDMIIGGHTEPILSATFALRSDTAFTVARDGKIQEHSLQTGQHTELGKHESPIVSVAISTDRQVMLTSDSIARVKQWDLLSKKLTRELATDGKPVSHLMICENGNAALGLLDKNLLRRWDLRTGVLTDFPIADGVRSVAFSANGLSILVVVGHDRIFPAHPIHESEALQNGEPPHLAVIQVDSTVQSQVNLDSLPVGCKFAEGDEKFIVLTRTGSLEIYSAKTQQKLFTVKGPQRIMRLLDDQSAPTTIYTVSSDRVNAWNTTNGKMLADIQVSLSDYEAAMEFPSTIVQNSRSTFHIMMSNGAFLKYPRNCLEYARKIAPRELTNEERLELNELLETE